MAESHDLFLSALDDGWVLTGDALAAYARTDTDEFDPIALASGRTREPTTKYDVDELRSAVQADRDLLTAFGDRAGTVTPDKDPKLAALVDALVAILGQSERDSVGPEETATNRKVLIFSYFRDTVDWIVGWLESATAADPRLQAYANRITFVSGQDGDKADAMFGFAPLSTQAPPGRDEDMFDVLVATDVLAEGVNLQQARHIINYDLPWNPMRLVQRHGRIDRIGSPHPKVWMRCFFPSRLLDDLLGLEQAIQRKIAKAAASVGVSDEILPGSKVNEVTFAHTAEQIRAIEAEDSTLLREGEETGTLSGEEFRRVLEEAMADPSMAEQVRNLPWVSGSGFAVPDGQQPGFVFCARVADHPVPLYRWVPTDHEGTLTWTTDEAGHRTVDGMAGDTLTALGKATCDAQTPRAMPKGWRQAAYVAWEAARADVFADWSTKTDPAAIKPAVPKPMRDAAALVEAHLGMST